MARLIGMHVHQPNIGIQGTTVSQIFTKSPRSLYSNTLPKLKIPAGVLVVAHCGYLVHLMHGPNSSSANSLLHEAKRCASLGIPDLVVHYSRAPLHVQVECVMSIVDRWPADVRLLIENNAGEPYGRAWAMAQALSKYMPAGTCFDTCHAWVDGITDLREVSQAQLVHVNDSMHPHGSMKDRHASLGRGTIPLTELLSALRNTEAPLVLETPNDGIFDDLLVLRDCL